MRSAEARSSAGTACGKVILLGEHAVVHGVPAIAVGIDRGAKARAFAKGQGPSELHVQSWNVDVREGDTASMLGRAFTAIVEATRTHLEGEGIPFEPCLVEASADLPPGGGLGCSAATGVAVARALDPSAAPSVVAARAMEWERVFHGNPSGIDAAVAARGGSVLFERGAPIVQLRVRSELTLVIGSSGMASSTKSMVDLVAKKLSTQPDVTRGIFERIRGLVREARAAIEAGDVATLGRLLVENQACLAELSLSTPEIDALCRIAAERGALGAKLTGAGGGGSVVALVDSTEVGERVLAGWRAAGFDGFSARVRAPSDTPTRCREEVSL